MAENVRGRLADKRSYENVKGPRRRLSAPNGEFQKSQTIRSSQAKIESGRPDIDVWSPANLKARWALRLPSARAWIAGQTGAARARTRARVTKGLEHSAAAGADRRLGRRRGADARGGRAPDVDWRIEERPHRHAALARVKKPARWPRWSTTLRPTRRCWRRRVRLHCPMGVSCTTSRGQSSRICLASPCRGVFRRGGNPIFRVNSH